ncbi:MAG: hypothetical protein Roseis2KO_42210 [Roseivirga sp.]
MKYHLPTFCLLFISLFACGGNTEDKDEKAVMPSASDDFQVYQIDVNGPKVSLFDLIEKVEIMRLEETEESLLSYVGQVIDTGDEYIFNSGKEGDIYRYSKTGEYKTKINRKGEGPEEYFSTQSLWVEGDSIFVYTKSKKTVKQYLLNGDFVSSRDMPAGGTQIVPFGNGYAMDLNSTVVDDSLTFNVMLLDKDFARGPLYGPFTQYESFFSVSTSYNGLYPYKKDLAYMRALSDTLFLVNEQGMRPLAYFDFGEDWLWKDTQLFNDSGAASDAMQSRGLIWNLNAQVHPRWLLIDYITGFTADKTIIIDRSTGAYRHIDYRMPDTDPASFVTIRWEGDRLFCSMPSSVLADFIEQLGEERWEMRTGTTLEEIESSENPVLIWLKFKDQLPD